MTKWAARTCLLLLGATMLVLWVPAFLLTLIVAFVSNEPLRQAVDDSGMHLAEMASEWLEAWEKAPGATRGD